MTKKAYELKSIVDAGAGIVIDGSAYSTYEIKSIAEAAFGKNLTITVKNAGAKSTYDLKSIAEAGNGKVIFDFL